MNIYVMEKSLICFITLFSLLFIYFVNHLLLDNSLLWHHSAIPQNIYFFMQVVNASLKSLDLSPVSILISLQLIDDVYDI